MDRTIWKPSDGAPLSPGCETAGSRYATPKRGKDRMAHPSNVFPRWRGAYFLITFCLSFFWSFSSLMMSLTSWTYSLWKEKVGGPTMVGYFAFGGPFRWDLDLDFGIAACGTDCGSGTVRAALYVLSIWRSKGVYWSARGRTFDSVWGSHDFQYSQPICRDSRYIPNSSTTKVLDGLCNYHHTIDTCLDYIVNKDIVIVGWNSIRSEHTRNRKR